MHLFEWSIHNLLTVAIGLLLLFSQQSPFGKIFYISFCTVGIFITVPITGDLSSCLNLKAKKCSKVGIWEQTNKKMMTINDNSWATLADVKKVQEVKLIVQKITK